MGNVIKHARVIFLLLAGSVIIGHMCILHDHHTPESAFGQSESCPVSGEHNHHRPFFPGHCYAFNDLAFEKHSGNIITYNIHSGIITVLWNSDDINADLFITVHNLSNLDETVSDNHAPGKIPLRAPPVFFL